MNPKVSVIMPCYNEPAEIFRRSLESVINQTLEEVEIIIILDNPENNELEWIISEYQRICDRILLLIPDNNLGRWEARNLGVSFAEWEYLAIHDSDDIDLPERLEKQLRFMEENSDLSAMISRVSNVDENWTLLSQQPKWFISEEDSFFRKGFNHPTLFMRRGVFKKHSGYKNINFWEDMDLWIRMYLGWEELWYQDKILSNYLYPKYSSHSNYLEKMLEWKSAWIKRGIRYFHHPKAFLDIHFYRVLVRSIIDYSILTIAPSYFSKCNSMIVSVMERVRRITWRIN